MLVRLEVQFTTSTASPTRLLVFASGIGVGLGQTQWHNERASSARGEGRKINGALLARESVEQVDDFAGWVKAKRVDERVVFR